MKYPKRENKNQTALFGELEFQTSHGLYAYERYWHSQGYGAIAGVDEAGRGPLAGPVVAGAVVLPPGLEIPHLNDSKQVSAKRREILFELIREKAVAYSWSRVEPVDIDRVNIYQASRLAMIQALLQMGHPFDLVLSDAMPLPDLSVPCIPIIHGDALCATIAAASIVAKVVRDRIMEEMDAEYPAYGFRQHKGYGTVEHMKAIEKYGPCAIHRQSFAPIKSWRPLLSDED
ncbi:MAG: ribonuclease HII [Negativicutes bacterium]